MLEEPSKEGFFVVRLILEHNSFHNIKTSAFALHIFGNKLGINSESVKGEETRAKNPAEILWRKAGREVEGSQGKFRDKKAFRKKRKAMKQV